MENAEARLRTLLAGAGWSPERSVDISAIEDHHARAGYPLSAAARRFLLNFAGLVITYADPAPPPHVDAISILPIETASGTPPQAVRSYEARAGVPLTIIGSARNNHLTLLMDPQGRVYGGYDRFMALYGESALDAILTIVLGRTPRVIA